MSEQVIKLSQNAAERIKDIMSKAEETTIGVRVGVQSGGCAGMSLILSAAFWLNFITCSLINLILT